LQKEKSPAEDPPEFIALLQKQTAEIVALPTSRRRWTN
jgi:hypothetical protein